MSITTQIEKFQQQLELKLLLGKNFPQNLQHPDFLQPFAHANDNILVSNTQWTMFQIAAKQLPLAQPEQLQAFLQPEIAETTLPDAYARLFKIALQQDQVLLKKSGQRQRTPLYSRYFLDLAWHNGWVLPIPTVESATEQLSREAMLMHVLPARCFALDTNTFSELNFAKKLHQLLSDQPPELQQQDVRGISLTQWDHLFSEYPPIMAQLGQHALEVMWQNAHSELKLNIIQRVPHAIARLVHSEHLLKKEKPFIQLLLALHDPEHEKSQQLRHLLAQLIQYDQQSNQLQFQLSPQLDQQLHALGFDPAPNVLFEKDAKQRPTIVLDGKQSNVLHQYLYGLLSNIPLNYWDCFLLDWQAHYLKLSDFPQSQLLCQAARQQIFLTQRQDLAIDLVEQLQQQQRTELAGSLSQGFLALLPSSEYQYARLWELQHMHNDAPQAVLRFIQKSCAQLHTTGYISAEITEKIYQELLRLHSANHHLPEYIDLCIWVHLYRSADCAAPEVLFDTLLSETDRQLLTAIHTLKNNAINDEGTPS